MFSLLHQELYTGEHFHSIPKGSKKGIMNGLKLILDAESFDYAFTDRSPLGFRIAISDARDQAAILQESSNVYPGLKKLLF
jgi:hypothetical protein